MPILEDIPDTTTKPTGGILLEDIPDTPEELSLQAKVDEEAKHYPSWYNNPVKTGERAGEVFDIATENNLPLPDVQKTVDDITKEISRYYAVDPSGAPIPLPPVSKVSYLQPENIDMENLSKTGEAIAKWEKAHPSGEQQIGPNIPLEGFDGKVNLIKTALREMPASHYYALQAFTNVDPFYARQYLLRHVGKYITPDMPDFFPAFYEASRQVQGEAGWNEISKYTGIAENITKVGAEFWGLGGVKAAWGLTTAAKFAVQNVLQAPTTQEESQSLLQTVQERILSTGKSAVIGVAVAGAGKYIPNAYLRIPVVTGGFAGMGAIEAPRGEKLNSAIENAITILGFEAVGLAQKGLLREAAKSAVKVNPDLSKIEPKELETLMRDFNKQLPDDIRVEPKIETPVQTPEIRTTASMAAKTPAEPIVAAPQTGAGGEINFRKNTQGAGDVVSIEGNDIGTVMFNKTSPERIKLDWIRIEEGERGKNAGVKILSKIFADNPTVNFIEGEAMDADMGYWRKIGAKTQDGYFTITRQQIEPSPPSPPSSEQATVIPKELEPLAQEARPKIEDVPFKLEKTETQGLNNSIQYHKRYSFDMGDGKQLLIKYDAHTKKYYPSAVDNGKQIPFFDNKNNGYATLQEAKQQLTDFYAKATATGKGEGVKLRRVSQMGITQQQQVDALVNGAKGRGNEVELYKNKKGEYLVTERDNTGLGRTVIPKKGDINVLGAGAVDTKIWRPEKINAAQDLAGQGKIKEGDTQTSIGAAKDIKLDEALNRAIEKQGTAYTKQVKGKWINSTEIPEYGDYYLTENGKAKFVEGKKLFADESEAIKAGQYIADNTKKPQYVADTKDGFELTDTPPDIEHAEILPAGEGLTKDERALLSPQQIAEAEIAQQEGGKVGFKKGRAQTLKEARQKLEAFKMVNALTDKLRIEASDMVYEFVPREKRGDFIKRILNAKTDEKVKSLTEDIEKYLSIAEKRIALSAIKKAVGRVKESNSIAVDYVEAINSLLGDIDLTKVSEATKDRVTSAKEYIERQRAKGEDVSLPNKLLNSIERLNKKNIENITTEELKQLHDDIVRLEKIGRTKLKLTKERYERKKQEDLVRLKADSSPMTEKEMAKPEKIGEKLPIGERIKNTLRNVFNVAARKHLAITPMDVFFDRLDGTKNYKGANYEIFKKPLDKGFSKFLDTRDSITLPIVELTQKLGMKEGNFDRIGVHAVREQEGGEQKLLDTGYTKEQIDAVELSPQEMELYNAMRKSLDELRPSIEEVMRVTYNEPLGTVKNYFSFMTDFEAMSDYEMRDRFTDMNPDMRNNYRKNTQKGFTKERVGGKQKIKINAMEVFTKHVDNATYLVEMGSEIKRLGEIAASPQYREAVGDLGQEEVRAWIDLLARKGKQAGDRIGLLDTLRKHTGAAVLGFKLSSTLIQPTALLDGAAMIGHYAFEGAKDIATNREWREFSLKNFPELRDRVGDDPAYLDFGGTGVITKVERAGFWALQKLDGITASSVTAGAYKKYMVEHGLEIDFSKPNQDAIDYAQLILRKTQSSSFFKDLPPAFTRGELTGNKSLDRLVLQFQSFMLTRWSLIEHDMLRAGIKGGNTGQMMNIFFFLSLATLAEIGIRRLSKETVAQVTGTETKDWSETFTKEVVINALENVPFVSQAVNFANYGNVPVPAIGLINNIGDRIVQLSQTKDPDKRQKKELEILILLFGTATGMPGTLQVSDIVRKLQSEKQNTIKLHPRK